MRLQIYDLASRTYASECYTILFIITRGVARVVGGPLAVDEDVLLLMNLHPSSTILRPVLLSTAFSKEEKGDRLRWMRMS